ncbi:MAG TPA: hypothetical protein VK823_01970 [Streptosporangiaceae bacterium]|nr:hypothetical protein [Streptosporangiaceae bacterium]
MLCFGGLASDRFGIEERLELVRLAAGRLVERLVDRRTDGRADFGVAVRGRDTVDFGFEVDDFGLAVVALAATVLELVVRDLAAVDRLRVEAVDRLRVEAVRGLDVEAFGLAAALDLLLAVRGFAAARLIAVPAAGLADCMVLAAAVSAFAAVDMALVAVFIARMAEDIVLAEVVALVAAAVIFVAAVFTLVAAEDTLRAADAGVSELLDAVLRVERADVLRVEREAVLRIERAAPLRVDREAVLRLDREAGFRVVDEAVPAGLAAVLRVALDFALLVVLALDFGRLAVPDALRLTDLLRAVLAELRRVAARVVVTGTENSPRLDQLRRCYSTPSNYLHSWRIFT